MKDIIVSRIAITLLAIVLAVFGVYHFLQPENMLVWMPSFLPGGKIWIYIVGVAFILAAIALITHRQIKLAAYLLALLLFIFVLTIHLPNYLHAGSLDDKQQSFINMLKDTAIAAFALYIASNAKSF
ncbi:MAG TPA: hypothetical protein VN958_22100 [Chitinophagaceae bacterium]|jgi:uncharacterized membrane protein|nr:hypothetical protein [Chitinophagaceae bacterium]